MRRVRVERCCCAPSRLLLDRDRSDRAKNMPDLVTLEITFVSGGEDDAACLFWQKDDGDEQRYTEIRRGGQIS